MGSVSRGVAVTATNGGVKSDVFSEGNPPYVKSDAGWFAEMARDLHPEKPGTILHLTSGFDERLCQKYAEGSVKPKAYFLRQLLRSKNGWTYLAYIMDGSTAPWWIEIQRARRIADATRGL